MKFKNIIGIGAVAAAGFMIGRMSGIVKTTDVLNDVLESESKEVRFSYDILHDDLELTITDKEAE